MPVFSKKKSQIWLEGYYFLIECVTIQRCKSIMETLFFTDVTNRGLVTFSLQVKIVSYDWLEEEMQ